MTFASYQPKHFLWSLQNGVGIVTLNRPEKKNPLTFDSYAELRDFFLRLQGSEEVKSVVITGAGGNFCSGGDVHEIIGPLVNMNEKELLAFTTMTGDLIKAIMSTSQVVISAIEGVCAGAGAAIAMASDLRVGSSESKVSFLFVKVGLAGCDMGACAILPRIIGQGRAAELLYLGRSMSSTEALAWGFYNRVTTGGAALAEGVQLATEMAKGPVKAHALTKKMLKAEWAMGIDEAITAEAAAQALCMKTNDFRRAYEAFVAKKKPEFKGN